MNSRPRPVAITLWLLAIVCLALALFILDGWARWVALGGYAALQGVAIFYPRSARSREA